MEEKIKQAIEKKIRPMLQADGGNIEFISYLNGIVQVKLKGACSTCPMSQMTLKNGVERVLKSEFSEIIRVESV